MHTQETKDKIAASLRKPPRIFQCKCCGKDFSVKRKTAIFCSKNCSTSWTSKNRTSDTLDKLRLSALRRHAENEDKFGYQVRDKSFSSYPEIISEKFFKDECINFQREQKIGKWFADFVFNKKIILEIDGKQHLEIHRVLKDAEKDSFLKQQGYQVFRIPFYGKDLKTFYDDLRNFKLSLS